MKSGDVAVERTRWGDAAAVLSANPPILNSIKRQRSLKAEKFPTSQ
ncbi:MAG: hypothetical protein ACKERG_02270 [Candidatus Hodgkinia cicadicola]